MFAEEDLLKHDVVTKYCGKNTKSSPEDSRYTVGLRYGKFKGTFIEGIKSPVLLQGIGSFVNRGKRVKGCRNNCILSEYKTGEVYICMIKNLKKGKELFASYDYDLRHG